MKKIQATIRTSKFEDVRTALHKIGIEFFTYFDVKDATFTLENKGAYRGTSIIDGSSVHRRCIDLLVMDEDLEDVVDCIKAAAKTGQVGDGKIVVMEVADSIRIV